MTILNFIISDKYENQLHTRSYTYYETTTTCKIEHKVKMRKFPKQSKKIISTFLKAKENPTINKTKNYEKNTLFTKGVGHRKTISLLAYVSSKICAHRHVHFWWQSWSVSRHSRKVARPDPARRIEKVLSLSTSAYIDMNVASYANAINLRYKGHLQNEKQSFSTETKNRLIRKLSKS